MLLEMEEQSFDTWKEGNGVPYRRLDLGTLCDVFFYCERDVGKVGKEEGGRVLFGCGE